MRSLLCAAFALLKGGTGKSMLSAHLAVEAEKRKAGPVAVIDTDAPQGSLSHWWNERASETPQFASIGLAQLKEQVGELAGHNIKLAVVDIPSHAIAAADLVLIPVRPSPNNLRAVGEILEVVEAQQTPFCFVINGATPRTHITTDSVCLLAQHGKVAPVTIHNRIDFVMCMVDGRTVGKLNAKSRSSEEMTALWNYVPTLLRKEGKA